jgi:biopolymer transport protein ExbD
MAGTFSGKSKGPISGINVTPLVDVVLVLLIILMVSSTYIVARTL